MLDIDRISLGWQVWLTPRQTRLIHEALLNLSPTTDDSINHTKLIEWFGHEIGVVNHKLGTE